MGNASADSGPVSRSPPRDSGFVSVASRLALVIFALVAAVSLAIALELTRRERGHYVESKRGAGVMLTELFAASIAPALDFADVEAAGSSLGTLSQNREVLDAAVWSEAESAPLASLRAASADALPPRRPAPGVEVRDRHIDIVRPVHSPAGRQLGIVAVRVSLARENAAFASARRRILWMAFGLSAAVAGLLVAVVRRTIVSPLRSLEKAASRLARGELVLVMDGREDEVGSLGRTFNAMANAIAEREVRISGMKDRLQGLLDHMRQAILVFDASGSLAEERSRLARRVFGDAAGEETSIAELLYPPHLVSEVERDAFCAWVEELAVSEDEELDELLSLAPREVTLTRSDNEEQVLELEFRRAPSEGGVARFMLLATDVTLERHLQKTAESQARSYQKQLTAARRLLAGGGQLFVRFMQGARERLERAERMLRAAHELDPKTLEELFRFVHTLRAEARSFDLERIEALASDLELSLSGARHTPLDSSLRSSVLHTLQAGLGQLALELDQAEEQFVQSSPIGRRVLEQVTVSRDDVEELFRRLGHEQGALGQIVARLAARPFGELVAPFPEAVRRWSQKEGKLVELVIEGREQLVPASLCSVLGGALAHLLRNAVAHGVEAPAERRAMGKPENGRIEVFCHDRADGVMIGVNDDGAGFDLLALQRRANVQGHVLGDTMDMLDIAALPGISTREASDELAGHGVGLGAVREELRQVGYVLRLVPTNGCGAQISIEPARPSNAPSEGISQAPLAEARHG